MTAVQHTVIATEDPDYDVAVVSNPGMEALRVQEKTELLDAAANLKRRFVSARTEEVKRAIRAGNDTTLRHEELIQYHRLFVLLLGSGRVAIFQLTPKLASRTEGLLQ